MLIRKAALFGVLVFYAAPALADPQLNKQGRTQKTAVAFKDPGITTASALTDPQIIVHRRTPKKVAAFDVRDTSVEVIAVTRRARANTEFHRRYVDESLSMAKVYPGYPKPAYVSVDMRVKF